MKKKIVFMQEFAQSKERLMGANVVSAAPVGVLTPQEEYTKNVAEVNSYIAGILKSGIPSISPVPDHYAEFSKEYMKAQSKAMLWNDIVGKSLLTLPTTVQIRLANLEKLFTEAVKCSEKLIKTPTDSYLKETLSQDIDDSIDGVDFLIELVKGLLISLTQYKDDLPEQAKILSNISKLALEDKGIDKTKVAELNKKITEMKNEVSSLTAAIVGLGIADGVAITLGVVALFIPFGWVATIFLGVAAAVATTYIVLDSLKIKELNKAIKVTAETIGEYNTAVAQLQNLSEDFAKLALTATQVIDNVKYVLAQWNMIRNELEVMQTEIKEASSSYEAEDWASTKKDFEAAQAKSAELIKDVAVLKLDSMLGTTATLEAGMSPDGVAKSMAAGKQMPFVKYADTLRA